MADQPEALRLAAECDTGHPLEEDAKQAAAELRRLHDHTQMLEHAYKSACNIVEEQDKKLAELEAVNRELLEALKTLVYDADVLGWDTQQAHAAIARAEGEQK